MRGASRLLALMVVAIVSFQALPVSATSVVDPNDVEGVLDLSRVTFTKSADDGSLTITVRTYERWVRGDLDWWQDWLRVRIDSDRDHAREYVARVKVAKHGWVVLISGVTGSTLARIKATRPDGRSIRFTIPSGNLANAAELMPHIRVASHFIETMACDPASGQQACVDRLPDAGWA